MAWLSGGYSNRTQIDVTGTATPNVVMELEAYYNSAKIVNDGVFEWFVSPVVRYSNVEDRTYIAYVDSAGNVPIMQWDATTKTLSEPINLWTDFSYYGINPGDDHGCPSVHVIKNGVHAGKILVAISEHSQFGAKGGRLEVRRSKNTETIGTSSLDWDTAISIEPDGCAYAKLAENSSGDIFLFVRQEAITTTYDPEEWVYKSTDGGATWDSGTLFADLGSNGPVYCMVTHDDATNKIGVMLSFADGDDLIDGAYRYKDIIYAESINGGTSWQNIDGTALTLPITYVNADIVYDTPDPTGFTFLWDITLDSSGDPYLLSLDQDGRSTADGGETVTIQRHHYVTNAWVTEDIIVGASGGIDVYPYRGGAVFADRDPSVVYACMEDGNSKGQLQKWELDGTWSKTEDITQNSPGDHFRPIAVKNGAEDFQVLFSYSEKYNSWEPGEWTSSLFAYPGYNNKDRIQFSKNCNSDFSDLRFTSSDELTLLGDSGRGFLREVIDGYRAKIGIKLPSIGTTYCYYGLPSNTYPTDDNAVVDANYIFGDNFPGATIDATRWDSVVGYTDAVVSGGEASTDTTQRNQSIGVLGFGEQMTLEYKTTATIASRIAFFIADSSNRIQVNQASIIITIKSTVSGSDQATINYGEIPFPDGPALDEYIKYTYRRNSLTNLEVYVNDTLFATYTETQPVGDLMILLVNVEAGDTATWKNVTVEPIPPSNLVISAQNTIVLTGNVQITIEDDNGDPVVGATYSIDGTGAYTSGQLVPEIVVGDRLIAFSEVAGYTKPVDFNVTVTDGGTSAGTGVYTFSSETVTLDSNWPTGAEIVVNGITYTEDATIQLEAGSYTAVPSDVSGYTNTGTQNFTVVIGEPQTITITYTEQTSSGDIRFRRSLIFRGWLF